MLSTIKSYKGWLICGEFKFVVVSYLKLIFFILVISRNCYFRTVFVTDKGSFWSRNVFKINRFMTTSDVLFACQKCIQLFLVGSASFNDWGVSSVYTCRRLWPYLGIQLACWGPINTKAFIALFKKAGCFHVNWERATDWQTSWKRELGCVASW